MFADASEVSIYDLGARLLQQVVAQTRGEGRYVERRDSRGKSGMVAPGLYLARVAVDTDLGIFEQTRTIAVAY